MQVCNHYCHDGSHVCCLDRVPIFDNLASDEKKEVAEITYSEKFEKGDMIYQAGDSGGKLFVLNSGRVKLYRLSLAGREQILRFIEPGEFMGELSLFSSLPLTDFAEATEETTMCVLQGDSLKKLMGKYPSIAFKVMDELSLRLGQAEKHIENLSLSSVDKRIAESLLYLSKGEKEIHLPMTKGDWASQLGITQETLSRKLSALQEQELIHLEGHRKIFIKDEMELENISLEE